MNLHATAHLRHPSRIAVPILGAILALAAMPLHATTVQDLTRIKGHEANVVTGLGIVIGLNGTGDKSKDALVVARPMARLLTNLGAGVGSLDELAKADAFAIVQVTLEIPPTGAREGDQFDIYVEALFNARSLEGGRLVPSMLRLPLPDAPDLLPLAMGQGAITIDGRNPRAGIIRRGGTVLADHDFRTNPVARDGTITLVLRNEYASYAVATTIAQAINDEFVPVGYPEIAYVEDAKNIRVLIPESERPTQSGGPANFIAAVQTIRIDPALINTPARVVVNERVGSIVIMGNVEVSPVAITHEGLSITFITPPITPTEQDPMLETTRWARLETTRPSPRDSARLDQLIRAFDQLNIPARDRIAIIHQLKKAGALHAEIIVE